MNNKMKVALVDNMGNCFFSIARYLRDAGIDAHLYLVENGLTHFLPQNDTFRNVSEMDWIHNFPIKNGIEKYISIYTKPLYDEFENYDLIIACGYTPAYLKASGINIDIFIPYGADLRTAPFMENIQEAYRHSIKHYPKIFLKRILMRKVKIYQQKAIQEARIILAYAPIRLMQEPLERLKVNYINEQMPLLYTKEIVNNNTLTDWLEVKYINQLDDGDFIVFNHSRQAWSTNTNNLKDFDQHLGIKRNDRVIKAFAKFVSLTHFKKPLLVLFEYGPDVKDSKQLIKQLRIEQNVIWLPILPRKMIMLLLKQYAFIGTDQYRENISDGLSGTAYEVLSSGVPLLGHHAHKDLPENKWYLESPIIEVLTEDDILEIFCDYEKNPLKYKEIGEKSKQWFEANLGQGLADKYIKLIHILNEDKSIEQTEALAQKIFNKQLSC